MQGRMRAIVWGFVGVVGCAGMLAGSGCGNSRNFLPGDGQGGDLGDVGETTEGLTNDIFRPQTDQPTPPPTDTATPADQGGPQCTTAFDCAAQPWTAPCPGDWQCVAGSCVPVCAPQCQTQDNCIYLPWGERCPGHWQCTAAFCAEQCALDTCGDGVCDAAIGESASSCSADCQSPCVGATDCRGLPWNQPCAGRWTCEQGNCLPACDSTACGNGSCEAATGETAASCPNDCSLFCLEATECLSQPWSVACQGHWQCRASRCVATCDYTACGDGVCDVLVGETMSSCAPDCGPTCAKPDDCAGLPWGAQCLGAWVCHQGACRSGCMDAACGNGTCDQATGESAGSCPSDCRRGCADVAGCAAYPWTEDCTGRWQCTGALCQPLCDSLTCGDALCDAAGGETLASCPVDCMPQCGSDSACRVFAWPRFCAGHWQCLEGACQPVCDLSTCGDGTCDAAGGESPTSCPGDCSPGCEQPVECLLLPWTESCVGAWTCDLGRCTALCAAPECGNHRCDQTLGESQATCPGDCGAVCETVDTCLLQSWPVACPGHWTCDGLRCAAVCELATCGDGTCDAAGGESDASCPADCASACAAPAQCADHLWFFDCPGLWQCREGGCTPLCDPLRCPDGRCDADFGETAASCPADCAVPCPQGLDDCRDLSWNVPCFGRWQCGDGHCQPVCDPLNCGDGVCAPASGENETTCPSDCSATCLWTPDCIGYPWPLDCQGYWSCQQGFCTPICDAATCGNSVCSPDYGETLSSCPADCAKPCDKPEACLALPWTLVCQGHWACTDSLCAAVCESQTCGDGVCDDKGGETAASCAPDCLIVCNSVEDCLDAPWLLADCESGGHWQCNAPDCQPICDEQTCGDGQCDRAGGESALSCPSDCATQCVQDGLRLEPGLQCCAGLTATQDCWPGQSCPAGEQFCLRCGDAVCGAHEQAFNCTADCVQGCVLGSALTFACADNSVVPWCQCEDPPCRPVCVTDAEGNAGWRNSCTQDLIRSVPSCGDCQAQCLNAGGPDEAWRSSCDLSLIAAVPCAPRWNCQADPQPACPGLP